MEDNEVMERIHKLANAIRTTRKIKNITQKELSEKAGVSTSIISQMENHKIVPRLETVIKLTTALEMTIEVSKAWKWYT